MSAIALEQLAERIYQQESELQKIRRELEARKRQLVDLNRRRQKLQSQLRQIDTRIAAIAIGTAPAKVPPAKPVTKPKPSSTPIKTGNGAVGKRAVPAGMPFPASPTKAKIPAKQTASKISLPELIVSMVRARGVPMTVREMIEEARRRGFRSSSGNFAKLVETRAYDLQRKGILGRIPGKPGFVLARAANGQARLPLKPTSSEVRKGRKSRKRRAAAKAK
jgi:hypothetical protein